MQSRGHTMTKKKKASWFLSFQDSIFDGFHPPTTTYTENCNPESKKEERIVKNTEKGGGSYVKMRVRFSSLVVVEGYIIVFVE